MNREQATADIKARWRELYPADGTGKGIICPLCGSGSGRNGTGITGKPHSRTHFLKCWGAGCAFETGGSVIDLYMLEHGMDKDNKQDFIRAVDALAATLGITIDPGTSRRPTAAEDFGGHPLDWNDTIGGGKRAQPGRAPSFNGTGTPQPAPATEAPQAATGATAAPWDFIPYYEQCMANLAGSAEAQAYLEKRGISLETAAAQIAEADNCFLGYDPAWISPKVIRDQRAKGSKWLPPATPRIIIPVTAGHYIARDIRSLEDVPEQARADYKKYRVQNAKINDAEPTAILNAGALYSGAANVFVVEGWADAYSVMEAGQAAIALNSTANRQKLIDLLAARPTAATLILCLDDDKAGQNTTRDLKDALTRLNISFVTADITGGHKDPNEALTADRAAFERAIEKAIAGTAAKPDNTATYLDELMAGEIERFKQAKDRKTGFSNLDTKTGGLYSGLYVLAAISSLGKTTLALQMADQMAAAGLDVLFFSMEQSRLEMVSKSLARITAQADLKTAVGSLAIRKGYLPPQVMAAVKQYREQTGDRLSIIEGNFNCDIGYIADYIRRYKKRTGTAPVVFIDYLQILQPAAEGKSRGSKKDEIDMAVQELKRLSRELDLTIIVISSLNRANYLTPFAFEALKESGGIEYTADVVWGLQLACLDEPLFSKGDGSIKEKRERVNQAKAEEPRRIKFICLKNRYGISNYDCQFTYYPANDLFLPVATAAPATSSGAKRI